MEIQLECVCCGSNDLNEVWQLPSLPLTGIYVEDSNNFQFENFHDETLQYCENCSHMQLSKPVDPGLLYLETYTHRTSVSPISSTGNLFLERAIRDYIGDSKLSQILEIGCNDGLLLTKISDLAINLAGFDPVLAEGVVAMDGNVSLMGGFGETLEYEGLLTEKIDLVVSAHTFEHIVDPRVTLERLRPHLADNFDFVIEVPSSVSMVNQVRMDQVFPQHVNYYSPASMALLVAPLGLHLVKVEHNFRYWGGTQLLFFSNYRSTSSDPTRLVRESVVESISLFSAGVKITKSQLHHGDYRARFAFGAAQMLPVIAYHLGYGLFQERVTAILDDNPARQGFFFPGLDLQILGTEEVSAQESQVLITALDSSKPLIRRSLDLKAASIILPIGIA